MSNLKQFETEESTLNWLRLNMPFAIKPKSKTAKSRLIASFTSSHAIEEVCKALAKTLYNEINQTKKA